jgi:hypothetical protein
MFNLRPAHRFVARIALLGALIFAAGCSNQSVSDISGIWRSEDTVASKNLVIEFVPNETGTVFSGSIIGFPAEAAMEWRMKGNEIHLQTVSDEPITQSMTLLSQEENRLTVRVNRTELELVRVDNLSEEDAKRVLP